MKRYRLHAAMIIVSLSLISGLVFAQDTTPESIPDTPLYAVHGPYPVGRTWFSVSNGTEMPLILVVWYPALEGDQEVAALAVTDEYDFPDVEVMEDSGNWGAATLDALPDSSGAPYPLVIFSTGAFTSPQQYTNHEEHLASFSSW
jgi:hypothetical protein